MVVDTCCHLLLTFFYWSKMTLQHNLESQEVRSCRKWDLDMTVDGEGTECDSSPRTSAMPGRCEKEHHGKRSVSPFSSFFFHQTASTLWYKKMSLCSSLQGQTHTPQHPSLHCSSKLMVCHYTPNLPVTWPHLIGGITCTQPISLSFISIYTVLTLTSVSPADIPSLNKNQLTCHFSNSDTATRTHPPHG